MCRSCTIAALVEQQIADSPRSELSNASGWAGIRFEFRDASLERSNQRFDKGSFVVTEWVAFESIKRGPLPPVVMRLRAANGRREESFEETIRHGAVGYRENA